MMNENVGTKFSLSIKVVEKNASKTYTDSASTLKKIEDLSLITNRSFNEILKEIVNDFLTNGSIYDSENDKSYSIDEILDMHHGKVVSIKKDEIKKEITYEETQE